MDPVKFNLPKQEQQTEVQQDNACPAQQLNTIPIITTYKNYLQ
jgi:hypothetical protein